MPSVPRDKPLMVNKGTQCSLLSYAQKNFQSKFLIDNFLDNARSLRNEYYHDAFFKDSYSTNVHGDVTNLSMGPTIIYKLDPHMTREILLGNPGIIDRFDVLGGISTHGCDLLQSSNSLENDHGEEFNDKKDINNIFEKEMDDMDNQRLAKKKHSTSYKSSKNSYYERKKKKCYGHTIIIYPRWWSCRQLFNQNSCNDKVSSLSIKNDVSNVT